MTVLNYQNKLTVFSRSVTKASHLYWTQAVNGNWSAWALIGGSSVSLKSDVAVAYNGFSKVYNSYIFTVPCTTNIIICKYHISLMETRIHGVQVLTHRQDQVLYSYRSSITQGTNLCIKKEFSDSLIQILFKY